MSSTRTMIVLESLPPIEKANKTGGVLAIKSQAKVQAFVTLWPSRWRVQKSQSGFLA